MPQCPKCKTENKKGSRFCRKCGIELSSGAKKDALHQEKRDRVLGQQKKRMPWKPVVAVAVVAVLVVGFVFAKTRSPVNTEIASQQKVIEPIDYRGQQVRMTEIASQVREDYIIFPLSEIKEARLVRTEYGPRRLPLLAYVSPSGRVVTAVSMCEPCRSTRFHIQDNMLVCNACFTKWDLESLDGLQGGCLNYPPDILPSVVEGDEVRIDEQLVLNWQPRE